MDPQSLFFVLVVIAIGGYSAYLADILGYKIGKKRLSIKRIRPKYVARISVVVAGMIIPIITMLLLYGVSSTFRTWITRGSEIVRDLEQKSKEVDKINTKLVEGEKRNALLENENKISEDRFIKKKKEADDQEKKAKELDSKVATLNASISQLRSNIDSIQRQKADAVAKLAPLKANLTSLQKQLPEVQTSLASARSSLKEAEAKYKEAAKSYSQTSQENLRLTNINGSLSSKNEELKTAATNLQTVIDNINKDLESLKTQKTTAEEQTKQANADLRSAREALDSVKQAAQQFAESIEYQFRTQPISFVVSEELTRIAVGSRLNNSDALNAYRNMMRRAKSLAKDRGAEPDPTLGFAGTAGMILTDAGGRQLSEDEVEAFWVKAMRSADSEQLLIARSSGNHFGSEPIRLKLELLPNPIVFRKGEIVTETRIDGRASELIILDNIRDFLRTFVNTKARQRKMIPVQAKDGLSFGEFSQSQLLNAVAAVKAVPRTSRLVAVAAQDIRAGDQLDISIEVR